MRNSEIIKNELQKYSVNEIIFASKLYREKLYNKNISEASFYKVLERMHNYKEIEKVSKGIYYFPKKTRYGIIPVSDDEIVSFFASNNEGMLIGYSLYNKLNLTTQVSKTVEVFSSALEQQTKNISNVLLMFCNLVYTPEVSGMIHMMEVLQNFGEIQDLNYTQFIKLCEQFSESYSDEVFAQVCQQIRYQKKTISFLRNILMHYQVPNNLERYLSSLSEYKHPTMEEIYEAAHFS